MEELLLMNPSSGHGKGSRSFQIVFPKKIKRLRANEGSIEKYGSKKLPLIGVTSKQVAGATGGAAATAVVPKMLKLDGWKDVAASGAIAVAGGGLLRSADKDAGEAFLCTGLGVTGLKAVRELIKVARGKTQRRKSTTRRSLKDVGNVADMTDEELDTLLGDLGQNDDDLLGALNAGIEDLGQEVVLS